MCLTVTENGHINKKYMSTSITREIEKIIVNTRANKKCKMKKVPEF